MYVQVTKSKKVLKQNHVGDNNGNFKFPKLVKETCRPRKRKIHKGTGLYQQDKAKEKLDSDDKKDDDSAF